jgi:hypothetical protein
MAQQLQQAVGLGLGRERVPSSAVSFEGVYLQGSGRASSLQKASAESKRLQQKANGRSSRFTRMLQRRAAACLWLHMAE